MKVIKGLLVAGLLAGAGLSVVPASPVVAQDQVAASAAEEQLGQLLATLGLEAKKKLQRYDFAFSAVVSEEEWQLSMSAVLSQDGTDVWIMAWLDELPKSSAEVPKTALLRLLAQNDELGDGKFFAYIPTARRFVMQRTVPNNQLTSAQLRVALQDLGASVVQTYPIWAVANWNPTGIPAAPTGGTSQPAAGVPQRSAVNDSKFTQPVQR